MCAQYQEWDSIRGRFEALQDKKSSTAKWERFGVLGKRMGSVRIAQERGG